MTVHQLLAGDGRHAESGSELYVPRDMLSDLYDHPVIITPDYVGKDRRTPLVPEWPGKPPAYLGIDRRVPVAQKAEEVPGSRRHSAGLLSLEALVVVIVTLAIAVPLTLMVDGAKAPAITSLTPASPVSPTSPKVPTLGSSAALQTVSVQHRDRMAQHAAAVAARERLARQRTAARSAKRARTAGLHRQARAQRAEQRSAARHTAAVRRRKLFEKHREERAAKRVSEHAARLAHPDSPVGPDTAREVGRWAVSRRTAV